MQNIFKVINMAGQHAFTDDNFSLEKSGWIKKTGRRRWQKKDILSFVMILLLKSAPEVREGNRNESTFDGQP